MAVVTLDKTLFRGLFAEFADVVAYPDAVLQSRWDNEATAYVSADNCGDLIDARRAYAIQCMLAHLLRLAKVVSDASSLAGVVVGAQIDKVQVQLAPPPTRGEWGHWLGQTPYGQQLMAYLQSQAVGGFYVGGNPERAAFRKVGGIW